MTTAKKTMQIALKVATWLLVAFTVFMMVFTVVSVTTVDRHNREIFGYKFYIVQSDSMSKSELNADLKVHFNAGDIIIAKTVKDPYGFQPGDIITFISANSDSAGETLTHMIRSIKTDGGKVSGYVTYGTNKGVDDEAVVDPESILGVYHDKMPVIGKFFAFLKSTPGYVVCILIPFLLLILYNAANVAKLFRKYRQEQMDELKTEREKLEKERAESLRMMEELLKLKEQLYKSQTETPVAAPQPTAEGEELSNSAPTVEGEELSQSQPILEGEALSQSQPILEGENSTTAPQEPTAADET